MCWLKLKAKEQRAHRIALLWSHLRPNHVRTKLEHGFSGICLMCECIELRHYAVNFLKHQLWTEPIWPTRRPDGEGAHRFINFFLSYLVGIHHRWVWEISQTVCTSVGWVFILHKCQILF